MADARIIEVCDGVAAGILARWTASVAPDPLRTGDEVRRTYLAPEDPGRITGRKVWVFPAPYRSAADTKGENRRSYRIGIAVAERYADGGALDSAAAEAWLDARVLFVEQVVYELVSNYGQDDFLAVAGHKNIWCAEEDEVQTYDVEALATKRLFWSELGFLLQEIG